MSFAKTIDELRRMTAEDLVKAHDSAARNTVVGINYFLDEIHRRDQIELARTMERFTRNIFWLTLVMAILTVVNFGIFVLVE